jgi:hypothetical protein
MWILEEEAAVLVLKVVMQVHLVEALEVMVVME